ncbi:MAG: hypothetical protein AMXMBFR4_00240 [Candidatus Hydrogenedentota bacterium]
MKPTVVWPVLAAWTAMIPVAGAGTLVAGDPSISGANVVIPVVLQGDVGPGVATMDFTFRYDPTVFEPVGAEAGSAARSARKDVQSNMINPGEYVVLVFGMNPTTMQSGEVASVTLRRVATAAGNQSDVAIRNTTFSSVDGLEIPSEGSARTVVLTAPPDDGGGPNDSPPTDDGSGNEEDPPPPTPTPEPSTPTPSPEPDPSGTPPPPTRAPVGRPGEPTLPAAAPSRPSVAVSGIASDTAPLGDMADRIAELNEATRRLEVARATLGANAATPGDRSMADDGPSGTPDGQRADESRSPATVAGHGGTDDGPIHTAMASRTDVASSNESPAATTGTGGTAASTDASGIGARGRLLLTILVVSTAALLIALRIRRRSA